MSKLKEKDAKPSEEQASGKTDETTNATPGQPEAAPEVAEAPSLKAGDEPSAPPETGQFAHETLHPGGGLPAKVWIFLLEAFDAKGKGLPTGAKSRDVLTPNARYQCAVAADGSRAVVLVHPSPAKRSGLEASAASHFEQAEYHRQRAKEYTAAIESSESGKRRLTGPYLEHVKEQLKGAKKQEEHHRRMMARTQNALKGLLQPYRLAFPFDKWVAADYSMVQQRGARPK